MIRGLAAGTMQCVIIIQYTRGINQPPPAWPTGKDVLDLYCYTGWFALNALKGGAARYSSIIPTLCI